MNILLFPGDKVHVQKNRAYQLLTQRRSFEWKIRIQKDIVFSTAWNLKRATKKRFSLVEESLKFPSDPKPRSPET